METNNTLNHHTGPEFQLVVGEGIYVLRDDLHLSTPPPHPSEAPIVSQNPLATTPAPPTAGVKLSLVTVVPQKTPSHLFRIFSNGFTGTGLDTNSVRETEKETRLSHDAGSSDGGSQPYSNTSVGKVPAFGAGNALVSGSGNKDASKRKKPKSGLAKTNSSYISRFIPHEAMNKRLQDRGLDGLFAFANINRAFQWIDLTTNDSFKADHLTKILFTKAHMLCHDVNQVTKTASNLDLIMGTSLGDFMWYEPMSQRYSRINKNSAINDSPISDVRWIPGSEGLFLAAHYDGTLIIYDKDREDVPFVPEDEATLVEEKHVEPSDHQSLHIIKSINSKNQKANPVASWKISNRRINGLAFSPDCRHLAVVSEDGSLRIIDYLRETLLDIYTSYYGGLTCVCWSPDGRYILTGGQDDLVTIWSLEERCIVARCPGHQSWVRAVAFDPWRCDDRDYRFGSVGDDCRLLLWDFNVGMLHRPKGALGRMRGSVVSFVPMGRHRNESQTTLRLTSTSLATANGESEGAIEHAIESRLVTAELPPVMSKIIDPDPLSWIGFQEDCIITACAEGHIRTWDRPREARDDEPMPTAEAEKPG